jgi:hypothetical protein
MTSVNNINFALSLLRYLLSTIILNYRFAFNGCKNGFYDGPVAQNGNFSSELLIQVVYSFSLFILVSIFYKIPPF